MTLRSTQLVIVFLVALIWNQVGNCSETAKDSSNQGLQFKWNTPLTFQVDETVVKKDFRAKIRHTFSLIFTNGEFLLRWKDADFLTVNGEPVDKPELKEMLVSARAMFLASPPMRISDRGDFLGTLQTKESIEEVNTLLDKAFPDRPEGVRKFYSKMADSPEGKQLIDSGLSSRYWSPWVGAWTGFMLKKGQNVTNDSIFTIAQQTFKCKTIISNLGVVRNRTNLVHLRYAQTAEGPEVGKALGKFFNAFSDKVDAKDQKPLPEISNATYAAILEVRTDPENLQPIWAYRSVEMTIDTPETGKITSIESYEYRFVWNTK